MKLSRAQRLAIAGVLAPHLRSLPEAKRNRRIAKVDADGRVVGYTTLAEVQAGLLARQQIEFDTGGARPESRPCELCGRQFDVPLRGGPAPTLCWECLHPKCLDCEDRVDRPESQRCVSCNAAFLNAPRKKSRPCLDCGKELRRTSRAVRGGRRCQSCHFRHRARATHCPRGHEFTPENTSFKKNGVRRCKACAREYSRAYAQATVPGLYRTPTQTSDSADTTDTRNPDKTQ